MPTTPLTAQECVILERYTSLEYYGRMRDTWEAMVRHVENLLERYVQHLPDGYRNRPLPKQPDIVWGERVIPNFRSTLQDLYDGYIELSHGDWSEWGAPGVTGDFRGQSDFWYGWMDEVEEGGSEKYFDLILKATHFARNINATGYASWIIGELSSGYEVSPFDPWELPTTWPRYRLNPAVQINTGEQVTKPGLYWPEAEDAAVQFLVPSGPPEDIEGYGAPEACVGLSKDGGQYDHEEPTTWIKVERVPGETVEDGLANLLEGATPPQRNVPGSKPCPRTGWWFTPAEKNGRRRHFKHGDTFPVIEGSSYGDTFWQWSPDQSDPRL